MNLIAGPCRRASEALLLIFDMTPHPSPPPPLSLSIPLFMSTQGADTAVVGSGRGDGKGASVRRTGAGEWSKAIGNENERASGKANPELGPHCTSGDRRRGHAQGALIEHEGTLKLLFVVYIHTCAAVVCCCSLLTRYMQATCSLHNLSAPHLELCTYWSLAHGMICIHAATAMSAAHEPAPTFLNDTHNSKSSPYLFAYVIVY